MSSPSTSSSSSSGHSHGHGQHTKRAWKLQEFVAHGASVNCLALGHKSGRVLVTGGDDKKVNLWAVGKPNCIMSLCGHTTPIECVRFGHTEELVCAGSASGALKIWDLEAARLVRTLTGHKSNLACIDFHPYGDFLATGSADTNLKLWDIRRKGCIFTYKGHSQRVNRIKFSPDGQWIASGGEEGAVKIWDLRAGKLMTEFHSHGGPVHDVEFHPHEFLLASASQDRTVNFWDLESFQLVSTSERDAGPVRCLTFHPEKECLFSASHDAFKVHLWEPHRTCDSIVMGWGKIRDIAIASTQLIGAACTMSNVSIYVVDLKRVQPMGIQARSLNGGQQPMGGQNNNGDVHVPQFKPGQHVRRSFVKEKPGVDGSKHRTQVKISEEPNSDKSGTDPDDSSSDSNYVANAANAALVANITDVHNYENIFRPRRRELNRTPPLPGEEDEPFQAPPSLEPEPPAAGPAGGPNRPSKLKLRQHQQLNGKKKPSPSPTRRASQPSLPTSASAAMLAGGGGGRPNGRVGSPDLGGSHTSARVRRRRTSATNTPNGSGQRPVSVYDSPSSLAGNYANMAAGSPTRHQRAVSVQPRSTSSDFEYHRGSPDSPSSPTHDSFSYSSASGSTSGSNGVGPPAMSAAPGRASSLSRTGTSSSSSSAQQFTSLTPVSRIQINAHNGSPDRPLDRPTLVKPNGGMMHHRSHSYAQPAANALPPVEADLHHHQPNGGLYHIASSPLLHDSPQQQQHQSRLSDYQRYGSPTKPTVGYPNDDDSHLPAASEKEKQPEVIPMNADKPAGLELNDFLPRKMQGLSMTSRTGNGNGSGSGESRFSGYKGYGQTNELSESEVTSSILKGHESMMSVLTSRGRNLEIIHKLWQNKDAMAAVDQCVSLNDQAVLVDLLSVISLRPSIWNLDLCVALLTPIGELLQSKYEMYINVGCGAMKLILKNFASVIKSNIDSPVQTVGVDISREERHNKCMQCYKDLVRIRSLILKRQTMQGKLGHTYRELSILMQYLD